MINRFTKPILILQLMILLFALGRLLSLLQLDLSSLSRIPSIPIALLKARTGVLLFYLSTILFFVVFLLKPNCWSFLGVASYILLIFLTWDLLQHVLNLNTVVQCSQNYGPHCIDAVDLFQQLDFGLLDINPVFLTLSIFGIIISSLNLLRDKEIDYV